MLKCFIDEDGTWCCKAQLDMHVTRCMGQRQSTVNCQDGSPHIDRTLQ